MSLLRMQPVMSESCTSSPLLSRRKVVTASLIAETT